MWDHKTHTNTNRQSVGGHDILSQHTAQIQHAFTDFMTKYNPTRKLSQHALQHEQKIPYFDTQHDTTRQFYKKTRQLLKHALQHEQTTPRFEM